MFFAINNSPRSENGPLNWDKPLSTTISTNPHTFSKQQPITKSRESVETLVDEVNNDDKMEIDSFQLTLLNNLDERLNAVDKFIYFDLPSSFIIVAHATNGAGSCFCDENMLGCWKTMRWHQFSPNDNN